MLKRDITNEDCMVLMKRYPDKYFELAIVDPPYGIGANKEKPHNGYKDYGIKEWDNSTPPLAYFEELKRVSKNQIIWGANYFSQHLTGSMGWIFWDKLQGEDLSWSDGELAYTSFDRCLKKVSLARYHSILEGKIHPTQKPVALYKWLLKNYAQEGDKILDTHLGSGSIAIACHYMGFDLTACELDKEYFDQAMERITNQTRQQVLL